VTPGAALRFRPVVEADLPRIMEIEAAGFLHPWSENLLRAELAHPWSSLLAAVAEAEGGGELIIGYLISWLVHDEVHILNVGTAPEARRGGVGRALMLAAAEAGRRKGARLSTLEVRRSNLPAIGLYRALGYREVGVRPRYYAEENEDAIVMTLEFDPR
jgi:ribosomal-protein-alanine N-acetyltransferase